MRRRNIIHKIIQTSFSLAETSLFSNLLSSSWPIQDGGLEYLAVKPKSNKNVSKSTRHPTSWFPRQRVAKCPNFLTPLFPFGGKISARWRNSGFSGGKLELFWPGQIVHLFTVAAFKRLFWLRRAPDGLDPAEWNCLRRHFFSVFIEAYLLRV